MKWQLNKRLTLEIYKAYLLGSPIEWRPQHKNLERTRDYLQNGF